MSSQGVIQNVLSGEAVYLDIGNRKDLIGKEVSHEDFSDNSGFIMFDAPLNLLRPPEFYINLVKSIGYSSEQCMASIQGFTVRETEKGQPTEIFPSIVGGPGNPYMKWKSVKSSAHRRFDKMKLISKLTGQKVSIMNFNITFPPAITNKIFEDPLGPKLAKKIYKEFANKLQEFHGGELGLNANYHEWSSNSPFNSHSHFHITYPNFILPDREGLLKRIQPMLSKDQLRLIKKYWFEILTEFFPEEMKDYTWSKELYPEQTEINVWFQWKKGFALINEPEPIPKQLTLEQNPEEIAIRNDDWREYKKNQSYKSKAYHLFKYNGRSYLNDVGKYLSTRTEEELEKLDFKETEKIFKKFVARGHERNTTITTGYLRRMKSIVKNYDSVNGTNLYFECYGVGNVLKSDTMLTDSEKEERENPVEKYDTFTQLLKKFPKIYICEAHKTKMILKKIIKRPPDNQFIANDIIFEVGPK